MRNTIIKLSLLLALALCAATASAQHTFGVLGGVGAATARFYPKEEMRLVMGVANYGVSWRYYSLPRFVGAVGADLEYMQRGFSYGYAYTTDVDENGDEYRIYSFYTRRLNTIMLPIVWQPHVYLAKNHLRLYLEAALTFSYNFGGEWEYDNDEGFSKAGEKGDYDWRIERDNRWNYGLAGGGGFALLFGRYELGLRARYYFGYADLMRNRNKYYNNSTDGVANPFRLTPLRSPIDNLNFSITLAYRFNKDGFAEWYYKPKRDKRTRDFNFNQGTTKVQQ
jgi:hypothetical protein